jgi:hypothetical protein
MIEITFEQFRDLVTQRGHDVDGLVAMFRGKIDDPREFFERVMSCQWHYKDRSGVVIPYRSVVEFYAQELHYYKDVAGARQRLCRCGCGRPVFGQYKFASDSCRKRVQRRDADVNSRLAGI